MGERLKSAAEDRGAQSPVLKSSLRNLVVDDVNRGDQEYQRGSGAPEAL
jgi:hypothetical protein